MDTGWGGDPCVWTTSETTRSPLETTCSLATKAKWPELSSLGQIAIDGARPAESTALPDHPPSPLAPPFVCVFRTLGRGWGGDSYPDFTSLLYGYIGLYCMFTLRNQGGGIIQCFLLGHLLLSDL